MTERIASLVLGPLLLALGTASCATDSASRHETPLEIARQTHDFSHWSYAGNDGPNKWGGLDKHFKVCGGGPYQSPVGLAKSDAVAYHTELHFNYEPSEFHAFNNGHTVQLNTEKSDDRLEVNGHSYKLIQLHLHAPSEHVLEGKQYPMEIHFVHIDEFEHLAVVGLLVEVGAENQLLKPLFDDMPTHGGEHIDKKDVAVDLGHLIPDEVHFMHYLGSLTTPPCTENVQWFVLETPVEFSESQVQKFLDVVHENSRPTQPQNNRLIDRNVAGANLEGGE